MALAGQLQWNEGANEIELWWGFARVARDLLPWRNERDPWRILVSEVMLAQTQATRVAERYPAVISRMNSPATTAELSTAELLELWSGLGYYRRALSLRATAVIIRDRYDGIMPSELSRLLELPGVGPYTARAILAFAFDRPVGVLDTNIGRVLALAIAGESLSRTNAQLLADDIVASRRPRHWNLALMDFGATICGARTPRCGDCPVGSAGHCAWKNAGGSDPAIGSAATSRPQARFQGSDREGRGRLLRAALSGPVRTSLLASTTGWPEDRPRAERVAAQLVEEGLLVTTDGGAFVVSKVTSSISDSV